MFHGPSGNILVMTRETTAPVTQGDVQPNAKPRKHYGSSDTHKIYVVLGIALFSGLAVRLATLGSEDYWLDELHSLSNSAALRDKFEDLPVLEIQPPRARFVELTDSSTPASVWRGMRVDSHPPLYFVVLNLWRRAWGDDEVATRSLSILCSVLSLIPLTLALKRAGGNRAALIGGLVTALCHAHISMSHMTRQYSMAILFLSVSAYLLVLLDAEAKTGNATSLTRRAWSLLALYALVNLAAVMTHYFAGFALAGQGLWALLALRGRVRTAWILSVFAAVVAFCFLWLPSLLAQMAFISAQPWLLEPGDNHLARTLVRFFDLPARLLLQHERFGFTGAYLGVGILLLLPLGWVIRKKLADRALLLFFAMYAVPLFVFVSIDLLSDMKTLAHLRYVSMASVGLSAALGIAIARSGKFARTVFCSGGVVLFALTVQRPTEDTPNARRAAQLLADQLREGDLVAYDAIDWPHFWTQTMLHEVNYYLAEMPVPQPSFVLLPSPPPPELRSKICAYDRFFLVSPRLLGEMNHCMKTHEHVLETGHLFRVGVIYVFQRKSEDADASPLPSEPMLSEELVPSSSGH